MPKITELCTQYFGATDLYEILSLEKNASEKDVKKAFYKMSLLIHPDRVSDDKKEEANEKFKLLSKLYSVLSDKEKRNLYDKQGIIEDDDEEVGLSSWLSLWKNLFKPITEEDIDNFKKEYIGSAMERRDIKTSYVNGKGCINYMMEHIQFFGIDDESRIADVVNEMIKSGEVPEFTAFTKEPASKRKNRHNKLKREAKFAESMKSERSLEHQLRERQLERAHNADSFFARLLEKYKDDDDDDSVDYKDVGRKLKKKMPQNNKRKSVNGKEKLNSTVGGRVTKNKTK